MGITGASAELAGHLLAATDGSIVDAVNLYYDSAEGREFYSAEAKHRGLRLGRTPREVD